MTDMIAAPSAAELVDANLSIPKTWDADG